MKNIFTVDVEDWYHILEVESTPDVQNWQNMETRVEQNFNALLDMFDENGVKVTCFILAWVAERFPHIIKEAHARGHEVASHGYSHQLVYTQSAESFYNDIKKAKDILEDLTGEPVDSYRCPGFSITEETPWGFEKIVEAGYKYDSSVFPANRGHGGLSDSEIAPHIIETPAGNLFEYPITIADLFGKRVCFFGGGYLRLFPYSLIRSMSKKVNRSGRPVIYYIHPREIDPHHPRLEMSKIRTFKSYVNLETTMTKLERIIHDFEVVPLKHWHKEYFEKVVTV
ncbi:MAG: polysaccharide deacetylase [Melioribacteraceae bacterium]|nr:MAG: polysaccharide deacetylase [Melioribacteraceae bacterium]